MIWPSRYPDAYRKMHTILENGSVVYQFRCIPVPSLGLRSKRPTSRPTQTGSGAIKTERSPALKVVGYQGAKTLERGACLNPQVGQYAAYTEILICPLFFQSLSVIFLPWDRAPFCRAEECWSWTGGRVREEYRRGACEPAYSPQSLLPKCRAQPGAE